VTHIKALAEEPSCNVGLAESLPSFPAAITVATNTQSRPEWDEFAARCGASFRGSYRASRAWQLDHHLRCRVHYLSLHIELEGRPLKIAQAAVGVGGRRRVFAEGLQILPEYRCLWHDAMVALLSHLGDGEYHYGGRWNLEPSRADELASIAGVTPISTERATIHFIDFSQWKSWESYLASVSTNAKRNAKRAEKEAGQLVVSQHRGRSTMADLYQLVRLRKKMHDRKQLNGQSLNFLFRFLLRTAALGDEVYTAVLQADGKAVAAYGGVTFGPFTYYMESGSLDGNMGMSWFLMLRMIREAYERAPKGRFFLGSYYDNSGITEDPGLRFFRDQCRSVSHSTSEVVFRYRQSDHAPVRTAVPANDRTASHRPVTLAEG
jgi:hypothetical protein